MEKRIAGLIDRTIIISGSSKMNWIFVYLLLCRRNQREGLGACDGGGLGGGDYS